jgi:hypothetical protein
MPLPETIAVKYTEEEAEYLTVRPVVRQTFRLEELVDMVVRVTGKDAARVQHILRTGTIVYNFYRYSWAGFDAAAEELTAALSRFPDPNPSRAFQPEECTAIELESAEQPSRHRIALAREEASRKRLFSGRSFWDALMALATEAAPAYREYSYARQADVYELALPPEQAARLAREAAKLAPRALRVQFQFLPEMRRILFLCPRLR